MPKAKSYMNPNIPKPKPRTSGPEKEERKVYKPMEPLPRRKPGAPDKREKRPLPRPINPLTPGDGKREKRPLPRPLPGVKKPFDPNKERKLPRRVTPGSIKKSVDMGARSRNQRSPRLRGGR